NDLRTTLPNAVGKSSDFNKVIDNYVAQWDSELGKEVLFRHISLLNPIYVNSVSSVLRNLGKPTLIIWGEKDEQNPIKYAHRLNREIADSTLVIVPGAGHIAIFDAPDTIADAITDFVQGL
ncbi:MAG TPA: alpha/beta hydrolase, partial [Ktedonobacteraceae bacterium]